MNQNTLKLLTLFGIFLAGSVVISQSGLFSQARIDMTENKLFTLNQGTKNIVQNIDEKIYLKLYFSDEATAQIPFLRTYKERVVDLIKEIEKTSKGKLELSIIDPEMFTPEEDEAAQFGLQTIPVGDSGENVFFGLVGENSLDDVEVLPFLQPDREAFLEYDIAQMIYSLNHPKRKKIGLMSSLDLSAKSTPSGNLSGQKGGQEQVVLTQLKKNYEVKTLELDADSIDEDLDLLMLIHPKNLSEKTQFALDQYVLKGGRLLIFVDPHAQNEPVTQNPENPVAAYQANRSSNLAKLFETWGVEFNPAQVVLDDKFAINVQTQAGGRPTRHLAYLALSEEAFNSEDIIARDLSTLNIVSAGSLSSEKIQPIVMTSKSPSVTSVDSIKFLFDPATLFNNYQPQSQAFVIGGRLLGPIQTSFPDGIDGVKGDLVASIDEPNVVIFADVDLLFDSLWVRSQSFFGRTVFSAFADNGNLIVNLVDNMAGSPDLINIRGRKNSARPFTKVLELQKQSDKKFRETENLLKQKLWETEQKLNELQRRKGSQNQLILSAEQEQEIQEFQNEKLDVRKKLREVRRNLDKDIKDLGSWLKFINIGLIPLLIAVFGIIALWIGPKKRRGNYEK